MSYVVFSEFNLCNLKNAPFIRSFTFLLKFGKCSTYDMGITNCCIGMVRIDCKHLPSMDLSRLHSDYIEGIFLLLVNIYLIEDFDFKFQKSITTKQINRLLELEWIDRMFNPIFLGPPGVGKTYLAIVMGLKAVEAGYKVSFVSMDNLCMCLKLKVYQEKAKVRLISSSLRALSRIPANNKRRSQSVSLVNICSS